MRRSRLLPLVVLLSASAAAAQAPRTISHQGFLEANGIPVTATLVISFELHTAASGGSPFWTETHPAVAVADGVYAAVLGSINSLDDVDFNRQLWLQVRVDGSLLSPRTALTGVPVAMTLPAGATVSGAVTSGSQAALRGVNTATDGPAYGLYGESAVTDASGAGVYGTGPRNGIVGVATVSGTATAIGVTGVSTSTFGLHYGVLGSSASTAGSGVFGWATATSGTTNGVIGVTQSAAGRGVYGLGDNNSGINYGVYGESRSTSGRGVYGTSTGGSGTSYGVYGESNSASGRGVYGTAPTYGVYGRATASTGTTYAVYGESSSPNGRGVFGTATASTGAAYGGYFITASTLGRGVEGWATAATGPTNGVIGQSSSSEGRGVWGRAVADTGTTYGVAGESWSADGYGGHFSGKTGVYGTSSLANGRAVHGVATGAFSYGVWGESTDSDGTGGVFIGRRGVRASSTSNDLEDLILGGTSSTNDDGRLFTDRNYASSDLWLHTNDAAVVLLDFNNDGEDADFEIRDGSGTNIFNVDDSGTVTVNGVVVHSSDFFEKEAILPVDPADVLDRVAALPVAEWSYRGEATRHLGPMAQDFRAAFGLGDTNTGIATVDADGVALAAIQALYVRVRAQDAQLAAQALQIEHLLRRVEALERE